MNLHSQGGPGGGLTIDEYIAVYCYPDTEKVESSSQQCYTGAGPKGHTIDAGQDSRLSITPSGLATTDVLCGGVYESDHI